MWVDPWDPNIGAVDDQLDHRSTYAAARHPGDGLLRRAKAQTTWIDVILMPWVN